MHGAETELDRQVLELVRDPLTHLVRNCADHGIESAAERLAAGKPAKGTIRLRACHQGGHIIIEIADDGRGLDVARIRAKAIEHGFVSEADIAAKSEAEICNLIFTAGLLDRRQSPAFPAAASAWMWCARNIEQIGGTVDLKSVAGAGTTFIIKIPLTLAIVSGADRRSRRRTLRHSAALGARTGARRHRRRTSHRMDQGHAGAAAAQQAAAADQSQGSLRLGAASATSGFVVVTQVGSQVFGIVVDGVLHTEEIVIKPMSSKLRHIAAFSGTTILGDGSVIMIIDPNGVAQALGRVTRGCPRRRGPSGRRRRCRKRGSDFAACVPRRLAAAEGGAALAGVPARGDRLPAHRECPTDVIWSSTAIN